MPRPLRLALLALSVGGWGCLAPGLPPVHPMAAFGEPAGSKQVAQTLGYAAAPGAGLGDSVIPGTPYAEGELRYAVTDRVQVSGGLNLSFQRYFLPWPGSVALGSKVTLAEDDALALAVAPRLVGASAFNLSSNKGSTVFGTREAGVELPLLVTHRFENQLALTGQVWGRYFGLRQEDATNAPALADGTGPPQQPAVISTGHTWAAGGAVLFSFPKLRHSPTRYHLFLGVERLWLQQTSSSNGGPDVQLSRTSLTVGVGSTGPW